MRDLHQVQLKIDGAVFGGWKRVAIDRGLDNLSSAFSLAITERWPDQPERWIIKTGQACVVAIGGETVLTGWIDAGSFAIDPESHPIEISGRDKTCDLVDCSADHKPGSWTKRSLEQIAAELAAPFGVNVTAKTSTGAPFAKFALQQGETVFEAIDRMAKLRGVLLVSNESGGLELRRPGAVTAGYTLELGVNIKAIRFSDNARDRFSRYLLKGQAAGDEVSGTDAARPTATATDPGVARHRPLMIMNDVQSTSASLAERARWEATVRAAKGQDVVVTVSGWRDPSGALYRPDVLVPVKAATIGVEGTLLVSAVRLVLDDRGQVAELTLVPKEAFSLMALPEPKVAASTTGRARR